MTETITGNMVHTYFVQWGRILMLIQRNFELLVSYLAEYAHYDLNTNKRHTYKIIKCADK